MAILVTGGAGYIGSHMAWRLIDAGEEVVIVDNLSTGNAWSVPPEATLVTADIGDVSAIRKVFNTHPIEAVIHFAGSLIVPESKSNPVKYYRNNTVSSLNFIEQCIIFGIDKFIFSSTAAIYAERQDRPIHEDDPKDPQTPYGRSKFMTEMMLEDVSSTSDFKYAALRYFNVAGADPKGRTGPSTKGATQLIKVACEAALGKRKNLSVFGTDYPTKDGSAERDFIHVTDLVEAHFLALRMLDQTSSNIVLNCGYGRAISVLDIVDRVKAISKNDFDIILDDRRPGDLARVIADVSRIKDILNWEPKHHNLDEIIRTSLSWEDYLSKKNIF